MLEITDQNRVRTIALARHDALNAFDEALYDATAIALQDAAEDGDVAVVILTGSGRAFCAGTDLKELHARATKNGFVPGKYGFNGLMAVLAEFPKPLICAVNGVGLGIGTTILGFADLAFMSTSARLKCPFTSLALAPEAASSYLLPALLGRQNAAWVLMSSEWIDAQQALEMGLVWRLCEPDRLDDEVRRHAELLASHPISSLIAVKRTLTAPHVEAVRAALAREDALLEELLGAPPNMAALAQFVGKRD